MEEVYACLQETAQLSDNRIERVQKVFEEHNITFHELPALTNEVLEKAGTKRADLSQALREINGE
jgi:hypothetical protein